MSIEDKKQLINALMTEYSQLKDDLDNRGRCIAIKNQVANIMYSSDLFEMLQRRVKVKIAAFQATHQPDEFITETFLKYVDEYDSSRNDNFYKYFLKYLGFTITNILRTEHPERRITITIEDDDGNELDPISTIPDDRADPGTLIGITMGPDESISEEEAEIRWRFKKYCSAIIVCVIRSKEHKGNRDEYYRAFATDFYISSCKDCMHLRYDMNENEAFRVMDLKFADWTLTDECRSFMAFESTPCKTYTEIGVTGREYADGEIETPFKNGVYTVYFGVTDGAISQRRRSFHEDIGVLVNEER